MAVMESKDHAEVRASLKLCLPSTRDAVHTACETVQEFLRPFGVARSPHVDVVVRELLLNAVIHGNRENAQRVVRCKVEQLSTQRVRITIEDEGRGFAYQGIKAALPEGPGDISNERRGYCLIYALAERLTFNDKGNEVTAEVPLKHHVP